MKEAIRVAIQMARTKKQNLLKGQTNADQTGH
jgi:hypothetical protein